MTDIKTVGIVGAGQMGSGIAHVCALAGYDVLLNDISPDQIKKGLSQIERNMVRQVSRGLITQEAMETGFKRIKAADDIAAIGQCFGQESIIEIGRDKVGSNRKKNADSFMPYAD